MNEIKINLILSIMDETANLMGLSRMRQEIAEKRSLSRALFALLKVDQVDLIALPVM